MDFRTRKKDGIVFPIGSGKEFRRQDDWKRDESELDEYNDDALDRHLEQQEMDEDLRKTQENIEEQERRRKKKELEQYQHPSFGTRHDAKSDVKKLMRSDDTKVNKQKEFETYKKRLDRDITETYLKQDRKVDHRREKALHKAEKMEAKSIKLQEKSKELKTKIGE